MAAKKKRLPILLIMKEERKGGWGRSMRGGELAWDRLKKDPRHVEVANDLRRYLDGAYLSRKLQKPRLKAMDMASVIKVMIALQATFPCQYIFTH